MKKLKPRQLIGMLVLALIATVFITVVNLCKKPEDQPSDEDLIDPEDEKIINQMNKGGQSS